MLDRFSCMGIAMSRRSSVYGARVDERAWAKDDMRQIYCPLSRAERPAGFVGADDREGSDADLERNAIAFDRTLFVQSSLGQDTSAPFAEHDQMLPGNGGHSLHPFEGMHRGLTFHLRL